MPSASLRCLQSLNANESQSVSARQSSISALKVGTMARFHSDISQSKEGKLTKLVKHPENYPWLEKMAAWYREGVTFADIARRLNDAGVKPSQSPQWTQTSVYDLLRKERIHVARSEQDTTRVYDRTRAYNLAYALKVDGRTLKFIAEKLNDAGLRPSKATHYEWYSVQELLRSAVYHDRSTAKGCAKYWKAQGLSLNEIARKLAENGHTPKRGGSGTRRRSRICSSRERPRLGDGQGTAGCAGYRPCDVGAGRVALVNGSQGIVRRL